MTSLEDLPSTIIRSSTCSVHQHLVTNWSAEKHHLSPALTQWLPASVLHTAWKRASNTAHPQIRHSLSQCLPSDCALLTWVPSARRARPSTWVSSGDTPTAQLAVQFWKAHFASRETLENFNVQKRMTKEVKSLESLSFEKWLKKPVMFHLEQTA